MRIWEGGWWFLAEQTLSFIPRRNSNKTRQCFHWVAAPLFQLYLIRKLPAGTNAKEKETCVKLQFEFKAQHFVLHIPYLQFSIID